MVKDNTIISTDKNVADTLNEFFKNAVTNLGLYHDNNFSKSVESIDDPVEAAIKKFKSHPSILKIKDVVGRKITNLFDFSKIDQKEIEQELLNLNTKKGTTFKNIPPKILKLNADICAPHLQVIVNSIF